MLGPPKPGPRALVIFCSWCAVQWEQRAFLCGESERIDRRRWKRVPFSGRAASMVTIDSSTRVQSTDKRGVQAHTSRRQVERGEHLARQQHGTILPVTRKNTPVPEPLPPEPPLLP